MPVAKQKTKSSVKAEQKIHLIIHRLTGKLVKNSGSSAPD